jgi:hypothetical protein
MKRVKWIISIFIVLICLVTGSELFQNYISTFSNQFYYFNLSTSDKREQVYNLLIQSSEEYNMGVFAVERRSESPYRYKIVIYADEKARSILSSDCDVSEGLKSSFFSGSTEITFRDFSEMIDDVSIERFYFTGTKDQVANLRGEVNGFFATSYIHREDTVGNEWLIIAIWAVSLLFLLLLTWLDIQFQKKENFVLMSLGRAMENIIFKNVLLDTAVFAGVVALTYFTLSRFIYLGYCFDFAIISIASFVVINASLYLTLLKYDHKQVLYGANISENTLSNSYILKAIVMIVAIASLSVNLALIAENVKYLSYYDDIDKYGEYGLLSITPEISVWDDDYDNEYSKIETNIFLKYYRQGQVAISSFTAAEDDERPIIILNENSNELISDHKLLSGLGDCDFYVFVSEEDAGSFDDNDAEFAASSAAALFGLEEEPVSYKVKIYDDIDILYFDFRVTSKLELGFDQIGNPVFVYCKLSDKLLDSIIKNTEYIEFADTFDNLLFKLDEPDVADIANMDGVKEVTYTNVVDACDQFENSLLRIVLLNSVISGFLLILEMVIIITIIRLEYMVNAKILSIKKILGYSVLNKNKTIFLLNFFAAGISIITMVIASLMFGVTEVMTVLTVGGSLMIMEALLIIYNIFKLEKTSIPKILKGGSL